MRLMKLDLVPMLQVERDLYDLPRGWERFRRYLEVLTGGTRDIVLPLGALNPMGKEQVAATLDALLAIGAETIAGQALEAVRRRLAAARGELKLGLVVADDAGGGWTNRYLTEAANRFDNAALLARGWATVLFWTSERPTADGVREEVLAEIYRSAYKLRHGLPKTLRQMLDQEGLASVFAGGRPAPLAPDELAASQAIIQRHLDSAQYPILFACLYGDQAAASVGYPLLGLPHRAGYAVATAAAHQRRLSPEAALGQHRESPRRA